jgi:hypothetical protein
MHFLDSSLILGLQMISAHPNAATRHQESSGQHEQDERQSFSSSSSSSVSERAASSVASWDP